MTAFGPHHSAAISRARSVVAELDRRGVQTLITGSLARGDFNAHSDVDFLVLECPRGWKYRIEGAVEDLMGGINFDLIYLDELSPGRAGLMRRDAKRIEDIAA